jgi:hypothetical protein
MSLKNTLVKILKEYVILEKLKDDFDVEPAKREDVEVFIKKHYLKTFPTGIKRIYAIYKKHVEGRQMVGMIIYGSPFMTAPKFLEPEVNPREVLELKRLYIDDIGVKNLESFVISQSLGLLKQDEPTIKVVLTFADDIQGHVGGIYQATNAIYLGKSETGKHKYAYILRGNLKAIKSILDPLTQPYPKKEPVAEVSREDFAKSLSKIRQPQSSELSPVQIAMKSRIKSRIEYARARKDHIDRGKCIHDENDAYEYSNKKKSLLCKECIETRYEPKRSKAIFNRICPHCLTYNLYYIPRDDRMSTLCRSCDKRRVGKKL